MNGVPEIIKHRKVSHKKFIFKQKIKVYLGNQNNGYKFFKDIILDVKYLKWSREDTYAVYKPENLTNILGGKLKCRTRGISLRTEMVNGSDNPSGYNMFCLCNIYLNFDDDYIGKYLGRIREEEINKLLTTG